MVTAAVNGGCHYLDSTGETGFIRWVSQELDARAQQQQVSVLSGVGYEYAISDIYLRQSTAYFDEVHDLAVLYAVSTPATGNAPASSNPSCTSTDA